MYLKGKETKNNNKKHVSINCKGKDWIGFAKVCAALYVSNACSVVYSWFDWFAFVFVFEFVVEEYDELEYVFDSSSFGGL